MMTNDMDFVREYAKAYFEADIETIRKLQELLLRQEISIDDSADSGAPGTLTGAPIKPSPHLNSGAAALPEPATKLSHRNSFL